MKISIKKISYLGLAGVFGLVYLLGSLPELAMATNYCVSDRCKKAEQEMREAGAAAIKAENDANSFRGEVARLNARAREIAAEIYKNQVLADDLAVKIKFNQEKLETTQNALADLLLKLHFIKKPEGIMLLAGSRTFGEFREQQVRLDATKEQVRLTSETIKATKEKLAKEKLEVERILAEEKMKKKEADEARQRSEYLVATYSQNAKAYKASKEKARKIQAEEIAKEIWRLNSAGIVGTGINTYPQRHNCPRLNVIGIFYAGARCQCTSYAGWKAYERWGFKYWTVSWGHAATWAERAESAYFSGGRTYKVTNEPAIHTVAANSVGIYGHVMWIERVHQDGSVDLTEYNNWGSSKSGLPGDFGTRLNVPRNQQGNWIYGKWVPWKFIHFD